MKEISNAKLTGCIIVRNIKSPVEFNAFKNINKVLLIDSNNDLISLDIFFNAWLKILFSQLIPSHLSSITSVVFSRLASVVEVVGDCIVVCERIDMYRICKK